VLVSEFHYDLPPELIAQEPLADRAASRMLLLDRSNGRLQDRHFADLVDLLRPNDLIVFNNSRVFPARLYGRRAGLKAQPLSPHHPATKDFLHGRVEVLLTRQVSNQQGESTPHEWECLVRPGRKVGIGEILYFGDHDEQQAEVIARGDFGERRIRFQEGNDFFGILEKLGHVPLPPYISRPDSAQDRERYQTVYARDPGSVAAPTAGLHFTAEILSRIRQRGIQTAEITLHVGLGTFQPIRVDQVEQHQIHSERYSISAEAAGKINDAISHSLRVIAVGTTTVRTLEHAALQASGKVAAGARDADLFIYPGFQFRVVQGMLTNFHLPESSLLMLVCALGGKENVLRAYQHATTERYRFYSYGDCMLIE
jgi:S-adenosylmethionine:tRNA ribosyltransferase-isomerase